MDVEQLHIVLQQSFSPDSNLRVPAEETIRNLKHIKGATIMLLQVAAEKQVRFGGISTDSGGKPTFRLNFCGHKSYPLVLDKLFRDIPLLVPQTLHPLIPFLHKRFNSKFDKQPLFN